MPRTHGYALVGASRRSVNIQIIADRSQREESSSLIISLKNRGLPIWIDESVAIAHNKVMVIDEIMVIPGSYNFTNAAENRNAENVLFIQSKELTKQYKHYWDTRRERATHLYSPTQGMKVESLLKYILNFLLQMPKKSTRTK